MTSAVLRPRSGAGRPRWLLGVASAGVALAAADTYVVVLALTDMMAGVGLGVQEIHRATPIISGFLVGYISLLPLAGRLSDLVDRRRVILGCLAVFVAGSAITALATDLPVLVAGRVVQGMGGGGLVPATLALVADLWPPHRRGVPLGLVGAAQEVGSVLGPVLGAGLLALGSWRLIFWVNAAAGLVLAVAVRALHSRPRVAVEGVADGDPPEVRQVRTSRRSVAGRVTGTTRAARFRGALLIAGLSLLSLALLAPPALTRHVTWGLGFVPLGAGRLATPVGLACLLALAGWLAAELRLRRHWLGRVDLPGAIGLAVVLGCLVLTFSTSDPEREVVGPSGLAFLPPALLGAWVWGWRQRRAAHPTVPRGLLRRGTMPVALLLSALAGASLVAVVVDVPLLARLTTSGDEVAAALVLVRFLVALPVGALLGGWAMKSLPAGTVAAVGMTASAIGLWVMHSWGRSSLEGPGTQAWASTGILVLVGLGLGTAIAPVNGLALAAAEPVEHGIASGLVVLARMVGMVVGLALLTAVGLRRYYLTVQALPSPVDQATLLDAALVQVQTVFAGGAAAAAAAAVIAAVGARRRL